MSNHIHSFPPIIDEQSKILILGTMPGEESLKKGEYYANPRNQFWKLLFQIFEEDFSTHYETKKEVLKRHKIALWDTIESCEREGSLDSNIKNEIPNLITDLLVQNPNIQHIICNGKKAYKNVLKQLKSSNFPTENIHEMPSTSPAHTIKFEEKLNEWKKILDYVKL